MSWPRNNTLRGVSALYRDAWNRNIVRRIGRTHNHTLKIKARVRAKGQRGSNWYGEKRVEYLRRKCRTSNLWLLQLSGDFHPSFETEPIVDLEKHHMMRAMLAANLAVDQRFANGTQGKIIMFNPASVELKKALPSSHPELIARFLKESSMSKQNLYPDIDHIDLQVRQEILQVRGDPVMLQLSVTPCYALTIHKTQALSIKHTVRGCLEGVFVTCLIVFGDARNASLSFPICSLFFVFCVTDE